MAKTGVFKCRIQGPPPERTIITKDVIIDLTKVISVQLNQHNDNPDESILHVRMLNGDYLNVMEDFTMFNTAVEEALS